VGPAINRSVPSAPPPAGRAPGGAPAAAARPRGERAPTSAAKPLGSLCSAVGTASRPAGSRCRWVSLVG